MKKLALIFLLFTYLAGYSQDFPVAWKSKFGFNPDKWHLSSDGKYVFGRDESQAELLDGVAGKSVWKINFNKDLKIKSLDKAVYNKEAGVILFFNRDKKKENADKVMVDYTTGKELWRTKGYPGTDNNDKFHFAYCVGLAYKGMMIAFDDETKKFAGLDVRTGAKKWESKAYPDVDLKKNIGINEIGGSEYVEIVISYDEDDSKDKVEYMNILNGETTNADNFVFSSGGDYVREDKYSIKIAKTVGNTTVRLSGFMKMLAPNNITFYLSAYSGKDHWSKSFKAKAMRQLVGAAPYVKLDVQDDKIFLMSKMITVFDLKTGNQLWEAPFNNADMGLSHLRTKMELGISGWPLVSGNFVYYVDLENDNCIKKVESQTGKVVWKSEKIKSSDRVPNLNIINGVLIAQFGGMIERQLYWTETASGTTTQHWKKESYFDGDYGIRAYNVDTGATVWNTNTLKEKLGDKFSDRITNMYGVGTKLVVASDKNLFCLDAKTGDIVYKTPISSSEIGDAFELVISDDHKSIFIHCDEGIACADISSGKLNYATKTGDIFWANPDEESSYRFYFGNNYFVKLGSVKADFSKEFIGFDLASGKIKGKMKFKIRPSFTNDGNYIFDRDDEQLTKYAVNKP